MTAKTHVWLLGVIGLVVVGAGCDGRLKWVNNFDDIEKTATRHQLREVEKRFEHFNGTYRIGIPDVLNVTVPDHPDLSGSYEVRPDGNVSFPLLKDVYVEGLTPMQLSDYLAKELERYVKKVDVLVTVTGLYSKTVYLGSRSQSNLRAFRFTGDMSVVDIIALQGGYTKLDYSSRIRVMRDVPQGSEMYRVRFDHILRGDFSTNVLLKNRDIVYVPATLWAEFGFFCDYLTAPARSLLGMVRTFTELPYAGDYGKERSRSAGSTPY
jgi:polysaccharide export outer membrane protein